MQRQSFSLLTVSLLLATACLSAQAASPEIEFADVLHQDMNWAQSQLLRHGYRASGRAADGAQYWWSAADSSCARVTVDRNNQVGDLVSVSERECLNAGAGRDDTRDPRADEDFHGRHGERFGRPSRHARQDDGYGAAPETGVPVPVYDLQGARASSGERELAHRGFTSIDGHGAFSTWWNGRVRECVQVATTHGYYQSVNVVSPALCR